MSGRLPTVALTERRKLAIGSLSLLLATLSVITLATAGIGRGPTAMAVGLASVVLLVVGTLSIGTSEQARV